MNIKPKRHAALIKAWADGAKIQFKSPTLQEWLSIENPSWDDVLDYRIKEVEKVNPYQHLIDALDMGKQLEIFTGNQRWETRVCTSTFTFILPPEKYRVKMAPMELYIRINNPTREIDTSDDNNAIAFFDYYSGKLLRVEVLCDPN